MSQNNPRFELLHLWAHKAEQHALEAFSDPMKKSQVAWSESIVDTNFFGVRSEYAKRLSVGIPPTGVFWIGGGESVRNLLQSGVFHKITPPPGSASFVNTMLPEVYDAIKYDDAIAVIPLGIHQQNHIVYSKAVLDALDAVPPSNWQEFIKIGRKARKEGYIALSMSDQRWQMRFLVNSILGEQLDPDEFQGLMALKPPIDQWREPLLAALKVLEQLKPLANADHSDLSWSRAVSHVAANRAMANVLGDFSSPLYSGGNNFICGMPPGNSYFLWSFDAIALTNTKDKDQIAGQNALIEAVREPENQRNYITRKGGIPAYQHIPINSLNNCSQTSVRNWGSATSKILLSSGEWTGTAGVITAFAQEFWQKDPATPAENFVEPLMAALKNAAGVAEK